MAISSVGSSSAALANRPTPKVEGDKNVAKADEAEATSQSEGGSLQAVHSMVSGALGLDDPTIEKPKEEQNKFYTAGKVLAAIGTVGTILSVLA
ncbi:hypothetical protein [Pseudoxanthomonas sp.]|uniref:hypothetical protein n=1 Tax=Pseudoxanthomonas sp. TaxID=1871049 RepID=UPI0026266DB8|nr:hypothetical protein [Pseudoxanthomonas sp.]WDS36604.1 MAG: hypothetical protein O8I58_01390 [Pseudoxanthomonas sp.]